MIFFYIFCGKYLGDFLYRIYIGMFPTKKSPKISKIFLCEKCNYTCCKQSEYNKHILTNKHKNLQNPTINPISKISKTSYTCDCGKEYKHSSTLYTHKKNALK
jgi:hypothetical protein